MVVCMRACPSRLETGEEAIGGAEGGEEGGGARQPHQGRHDAGMRAQTAPAHMDARGLASTRVPPVPARMCAGVRTHARTHSTPVSAS